MNSATKGFVWAAADKVIKANPDMTFTEFKKKVSDFPFSDATFCYRRRLLSGKPGYGCKGSNDHRTYHRNPSRIVMILGTVTAEQLKSLTPREMLDTFVGMLSKTVKLRVDIQELKDGSLEIRQNHST